MYHFFSSYVLSDTPNSNAYANKSSYKIKLKLFYRNYLPPIFNSIVP